MNPKLKIVSECDLKKMSICALNDCINNAHEWKTVF